MKKRALDLFCGGGGACEGLMRAGFDVFGIDLQRRHAKYYPGHFILGDALNPPVKLSDFDFIWASPPCQAFSVATLDRSRHPNLIPETRRLLARHPASVIENVPGAPLVSSLVLTGRALGLPNLQRERHFETSFFILGPGFAVPERGMCETVTTRSFKSKARSMEVMGITHDMSTREIGEAVPPAYAEYIARFWLDHYSVTEGGS